MYPNEARLRNFNYSFTIHYDVEIEFTLYIPKNDGSNKHVIETNLASNAIAVFHQISIFQ